MGKKDIIKVEAPVDLVDLNILGFINHNITVNIIQNGEIVNKKERYVPFFVCFFTQLKISIFYQLMCNKNANAKIFFNMWNYLFIWKIIYGIM